MKIKELELLAAPLTPDRGTLVCHGTPVGNHCSKIIVWFFKVYFLPRPKYQKMSFRTVAAESVDHAWQENTPLN